MSRVEAPPRRRILLSAYACSPEWGSEPGVGWRWALELGKHHDVTVVTHAYFREQIEPLAARGAAPGVTFEWFRVRGIGGHPHTQLNSRSYYWLWQLAVRGHVRRLLDVRPHDLIHHLTWGSYRLPSFLGGLGVPLAVGPVGGGEGAPARLYRSWPWRERAFYLLRQASIVASRWDPFVMLAMARADCILTKTGQTRHALPWFARAKAAEASEIGVTDVRPEGRLPVAAGPLRLLYAGRLLGGKGITYVLDAMKLLVERNVAVHLSIAGGGRLAAWSRKRISELGIAAHVDLLGHAPRPRMNGLYDAADLLVFPSWHDSSGNVVTEALARGLPVLCLDIGGPRYAVDPDCALIIETADLDEQRLAGRMAAEIEALSKDRTRLERMSAAALRRARDMTWARQVARAYAIIDQRTGWTRTAPAPT